MGAPSNMDRFWLLVGLKLDNEASEGELHELEELIRDNPEWQDLLNQARRAYNFKAYPLPAPDVDRSFSRHVQRLSNHLSRQPIHYETAEELTPEEQTDDTPVNRKLLRFSLIAGGIAASLLLVFLITNYTGKRNGGINTANVVSTRYGSKSKVQLADGTQVWLNADSKLTYTRDFGNQVREVSLAGEAFFDVQKDVDHPFVIHTNNLDIRVLGTAFNVRSYQNEKTSEATLIRGAIEVTLNNSPERKILMKPSDRIVVQNKAEVNTAPANTKRDSTGTIYRVDKVDVKEEDNVSLETVWKKNSLAFKNETLENVAGRIGHWFNVKVSIEDEELKKITYSCDFKDESLKQVMEALHLTGKFQYQIVKDSVLIMK
jgi:ferric-dicitrate binding protein FerR (iron transport regulator)